MSSHLVRRGGVWWVRFVVPERLRNAAGRREFCQSTRTCELAIAKLVCASLLASWRLQIFHLESRTLATDVLKLVAGSHVLSGGGHIPLAEAARESGIDQNQLLRAAVDGGLSLFCRLQQTRGYLVSHEALDSNDSGGFDIPQPASMPESAIECIKSGILPIGEDSAAIAESILVKNLETVDIVGFDQVGQPGMIFAPDTVISLSVGAIEVLAGEVDALRRRIASSVSLLEVKQAKVIKTAALRSSAQLFGEKAHKLYSEALAAYATDPSGIPGSVASVTEQKQKRRGCQLFIELVGDMPLSSFSSDHFREFRKKLTQLPSKANNIPKEFRRETMAATVAAMSAGGVAWPKMTPAAQHERMQWVHQMFCWLVADDWLNDNPTTAVLNSQTKTKAERKTEQQVKAYKKSNGEKDDSDDREPFTPQELAQVFSQSQYATGDGRHVLGNGKWYPFQYWLPLIAVHSGCRLKEVSQLHLSDIKQSHDGVWYFDINEITPDKSLKNANATRLIPMSPVLIDLGFLSYLERLRDAKFKRVFPELTCAASDAKYAKQSGRAMSLMFAELGMPRDNSKVFHCLRANFNDAMLRVPLANLPFDNPKLVTFAQLTIIGHDVDDVNGKHYTSASMAEKLKFVSEIAYDLPTVAKFDIDFGIAQISVALKGKKGPRKGREDMGPLNTA